MLRSQVLNLPPRRANAPTGSEFASIVSSISVTERENWIFAQISNGNVPNFLRTLVSVSTNAIINETNHTITYYVSPDYLALGTDEDYFLEPMSAPLGQRLADLLNCSLPTRKMINDIWTKAPVKLTPATFSPNDYNILSVSTFVLENSAVRSQRNAQTNSFPLGALTGGCKKDVILSNRIYTNFANPNITHPVVIYGWHYPNGSNIQPLYNGHEETYADYSHGIRLVLMNVLVDGSPTTLTNVFNDPNLAALVSDEGTIALPRYAISTLAPVITTQPSSQNVSVGSNATFSVLVAATPPLSFQWKLNGTNLIGATNADLSLANIQPAQIGTYTVTINNGSSVTSTPAILRISGTNRPVLFRDNFETNSSENWNLFWGAANNIADYRVDWSFDYSTNTYTFNGRTYVIPPAPNSADGSTRGVRFSVNNNDTNGSEAGVNIYPKNKSFSGNYVLKCDMWLNYPGAVGGTGTGIAGSTEHALFGINHLGSEANWAATNTTSTDGIWFAVDGEGGTSRDYRAYIGNLGSAQTELISASASGLATADNASGIYPSLFPTTRFETVGAPGKNWVEVEVMQTNNVVIWKLNGVVIAQRTNTSSFTNGNIMLGLMDTFPSIAAPAKDSFVIFDNVRVENLSDLRFAPSQRLADGTFQLNLLGVSGENYLLETSTNLTEWSPLAELPGSNGPFVFLDHQATNLLQRFYRASRVISP